MFSTLSSIKKKKVNICKVQWGKEMGLPWAASKAEKIIP